MNEAALPEWESLMVEEAIQTAQRRAREEDERARRRAVQLAREQGYHRLAVEIDRPARVKISPDQLSLFPSDPTLFDCE
ncbi:MAG: hypothetical protein M3273_04600 [Actinomycetota bacterium]|nr:hypothetical protein [Actinomycetota bacterium]